MKEDLPTPKKPIAARWIIPLAILGIGSDVMKYAYKLLKNSGFVFNGEIFGIILFFIVILLLVTKIRMRIHKAKENRIYSMIDQYVYDQSKQGQEEKLTRRTDDV